MAKLLKLRRGTTSQHGSFTGAEGEVTIDTDKETAVVHDGSTAGGHALAKENMVNVSSASIAGRFADDAINPSKIAGGTLGTDVKVADGNINGNLTIENADVTNTAAIAGTKISPNFGAQNIQTTGQLQLAGSAPTILLNDENNENDFEVSNTNGTFKIRDIDNPTDRYKINSSGTIHEFLGSADFNSTLNVTGNLDAGAGVDVTGNITVSGTVDGVDVAALKTSKDSLSTTNGTILGSAILANGVTATTQSAGDNSTKVATTAYTDTAITNLVDSSPGALNTLNELAAAINDDASFSTTVNNNIATKMPLAGGEFTGNVTCENITPDGDSSRNLGTNSVRFANVYADNFVGSGANLTGVEAFVSGMIILWSGNTGNIPSGFVLCNGSNSTPDLRDRFVVGAGSSYNPGSTGGSNSVTLSTTQIPSHNHTTPNHRHSFSGSTNNDTHSHTWDRQDAANDQGYRPWPASNNDCRRTTANTGNDTHNHSFSGNTGYHQGTTTSTGSGSSHENRPPYYALCYIMKT